MQSVRAGVDAIQDPVNIIQGAAEAQKALIDKTLSTVISLPKPQMMKYLRANPGKARLL